MDTTVRRSRWVSIGQFVLGFAAAPFIITGIYRLEIWSPDDLLGAWPGAAVAATGVVIWFRSTRWRSLGTGIATGAVAYMVFLHWLLTTWSDGMRGFD